MDFTFLKILRSPNDEILEILDNNIIGTPGQSMLYQHRGVSAKIHKIPDPYYVCLIKQDRIVGTCCFCSRPTVNAGETIHTYYVRYFSFKDIYRRKQVSHKAISRMSRLREEVKALLDGQNLNAQAGQRFFHYAYVDPRNLRSVALCREFGFEAVRQYSTIIFNRLDPKKSSEVVELAPTDERTMRELLTGFYKDYNMFSFENLFNGRKYYTIKDQKGSILAGVQVNPDQWRIISLPGLSGKMILNTFSFVPLLNRLFNKHYRFITLEGIYYQRGAAKILEKLFEHLLALYRVNSAIVVADPGSELHKSLRSLNLGLVDKLNKEVKGDVICKFSNFSEEERKRFTERPAYVSGVDVT